MKLYDLAGSEDNRRTSPYCWRIRLALAHKAVPFHTEPWRGVEKDKIAFTGQRQVPVLVDGDTTIVDSWRIAEYLETTCPEAPSFFGSQEGKGGVKFIVHWLDHIIYPILMQIVCVDALRVSHDKDRTFFRNKWEYLHGMVIEEFAGGKQVPELQKALKPMQITLQEQPFLGGLEPNFADLAVAGNFAWARAVSPIQLLEEADPVYAWRERMFTRFHAVVHPTIGYQKSLLPAQQQDIAATDNAQEQHKKGPQSGIHVTAST